MTFVINFIKTKLTQEWLGTLGTMNNSDRYSKIQRVNINVTRHYVG